MIVDAIGGVLIGLASFLFGLLPDAGSLGMAGFDSAVALMRTFNTGIPVVEMLGMAGVCLTIIGGIFVTRLLLTVWHAIPFKLS